MAVGRRFCDIICFMGESRENLPIRVCRLISRVTHRAFFPKALTISWLFRGGSLDIER